MKLLGLLLGIKLALSTNHECLGISRTCIEITTDIDPLWGRKSRGIDFSSVGHEYKGNDANSVNALAWVGCNENGCNPNNWFCTEDADGISFGSTGSVLRSLWGPFDSKADFPQTLSDRGRGGCAHGGSADGPNMIHNSPMTDASATRMCRELGYQNGAVVTNGGNTCPEPEFNPQTQLWESDLINTGGYGQMYLCTGKCAEVDPLPVNCDQPCYMGTSGPCKHLNLGDTSCWPRYSIGGVMQCIHGTEDCGDAPVPQPIPPQEEKCSAACAEGTSGDCKHGNLGDYTCYPKIGEYCPAGTIDCSV